MTVCLMIVGAVAASAVYAYFNPQDTFDYED